MILFITLTIVLLLLAISAIIAVAVGGVAFILVFGDVIVCVMIIVFIVKHLTKKRKK